VLWRGEGLGADGRLIRRARHLCPVPGAIVWTGYCLVTNTYAMATW
jgi:hypothetical protein